ncbi:MAG: M24 family metallopeptidase [Silvanigrellales bacterium]|nr:M24 family metallopeptidase [Silvanigrellales bacterium]
MLPMHTPSNSRSKPTPENVALAHAALDAFAAREGIDLFCITAQDAFLSEYTPLGNNQRAALSAFTGSTGDGLFFARSLREPQAPSQAFTLFVDGRYHLQADSECPPALVKVEKLPLSRSIEQALLESLESLPCRGTARGAEQQLVVAVDARRITLSRARLMGEICARKGFELRLLSDNEISTALALEGWKTERPVVPVDFALTGRSPVRTAHLLLRSAARHCVGASGQHAHLPPPSALPSPQNAPSLVCIASCASDDAAFLLNARGYHLPHLSSVLAYTFLLPGALVVFLPSESETCEVKLPSPLKESGSDTDPLPELRLEVVRGSLGNLRNALKRFAVTHILFNETQMNALVPHVLSALWPQATSVPNFRGIELLRARKTPEEVASFRDSYLRSSKAIAHTLRWAKKATTGTGELPSEVDLANTLAEAYAAEGALDLSFNTIAGTGAHGAIIHYGTPDADTLLQPGEMTLLDSGAYYAPGLATDCTRVFYNGDATKLPPQAWQKEIYTVTLKAFLRGMRAEFMLSDSGRSLDEEVRSVCRAHGYEYAHGTGHGVGIHVHEPGIRLSTTSTYAMTENACVSMEPGIYLPGKGGVRIENVVRVEPRDAALGIYGFENFMFVGFDWDLIDVSLLDDGERAWLASYERRCASLGTHVTSCPL